MDFRNRLERITVARPAFSSKVQRSSRRNSAGEPAALAALDRFENRLARSLAQLINLLDPDTIVMEGRFANSAHLQNVPPRLKDTFSATKPTPQFSPRSMGIASGVRGAAWLWPLE